MKVRGKDGGGFCENGGVYMCFRGYDRDIWHCLVRASS
jgi:hypothetical protein